jgi:hypothetical protein
VPVARQRLVYLGLALSTITLGLVVHLRGAILGRTVRDILGDALWASMIVWWVSALFPWPRARMRYAAAYVICALVELSQAYRTPTLDALRASAIGQLVLGSGFDPRDFVAYAVGIALAAMLEMTLLNRRHTSP